MMKRPETAIVLGAGVVGVATAYALAEQGIGVTLVDRREEPGRGASYANGAQLSYYYTDALANPRILPQLLRLALGRDSAFRLHLQPNPDFLLWLAAFLRNCTHQRFRSNTLAALQLGLESRAAMAELIDRHGIEFGHAISGKFHLYFSQAAFGEASRVVELKATGDSAQRTMAVDEAIAIEPAIAQVRPAPVGALYTPAEAVGDPHLFAHAMTSLLTRRYGMATHFGFEVAQIDLQDRAEPGVRLTSQDGMSLHADMAVVCAGPEAATILRKQNVSVPITPMKGYSFTAPAGRTPPLSSITDTSRRIVFTPLNGEIRVAGLAELGAGSDRIDEARLQTLVQSASESMPEAADYNCISKRWAGLRPMTPDSLPRIARPLPALAYNVGHGMLGWTMAMGSGRRLARLVCGTDNLKRRSDHDHLEASIERNP